MMNSSKTDIVLSISILILALFTVLPASAVGEVVVVTGADSKVENVSGVELRRLWLGKSDKVNGQQAEPIDTDDGKEEFCEKYLGKTFKQVKKYFIKEGLKGGATPPRKVKDTEELMKELSSNPAAIGFLDKSVVDKLGVGKVKIVNVDLD